MLDKPEKHPVPAQLVNAFKQSAIPLQPVKEPKQSDPLQLVNAPRLLDIVLELQPVPLHSWSNMP